ncbi:MAG: hypothetical protein WBV73_23435 [Phormidium sp.]
MSQSFFNSLLTITGDFFNFDNIKTILITVTGIKSIWDLYKEFWRKAKLRVHIESSSLVKTDHNQFDFQINFSILSLNNADAYLNKIYLYNQDKIYFSRLIYGRPGTQIDSEVEIFCLDAVEPSREIELDWAIEYMREDLTKLKLDYKNYVAKIGLMKSTSFIKIRDFKLAGGAKKSFTLIGRIFTVENMNSNKNEIIPTSGWYLCINYGVGKIKEKIFN